MTRIPLRTPSRAFTLLEVMIAMGLFFMAIFAILEVTTRSLQAARSLQVVAPDISGLAAELMVTEEFEEGVESGDFGPEFPGFSWERDIYEISTNGLFQVDFVVRDPGARRGSGTTTMSILLYRPDAVQGLGRRRR